MPRRLIPAALLAVCLWLLAASASAETRVAVRAFPGPGGADARAAVVRVLRKRGGIEVVPNTEIDEAAEDHAVRVSTADGRRELSRLLEISAWLEGRVRRKRGGLVLSVVVRGGEEDEQLARFSATRKKAKQFREAVESGLWTALGPAFESKTPEPGDDGAEAGDAASKSAGGAREPVAKGPAPGEPIAPPRELPPPVTPMAPAGTSNAPVDGDAEKPSPSRKYTGIQAALTANSLYRTLVFSEAFSQGLANYSLRAAPLLDAAVRLYPFAFKRSDWLSCIGLDLRGQMAFAVQSEGLNNVKYPTQYDSYGAGLVGRIPIRQHELQAIVGYNAQRFVVQSAKSEPAPVPSVDYRSLRLALGTRLAVLPRLQLGLEAAWLQLDAVGEVASRDWFPRAKAFAVEGRFYADIGLMGTMLNLRAHVAYQQTRFDFDPRVGDARVARSARDVYLTAGLGLAFAY